MAGSVKETMAAESLIQKRMREGVHLAEQFREKEKIPFSELKPSLIPELPGVYAIGRCETDEVLYVGRTKNLRRRIYTNHLHGPEANARLKKYLVVDEKEPLVKDLKDAKEYIRKHCYCQFMVEPDMITRGRAEGLLGYLLCVRYMYEEH